MAHRVGIVGASGFTGAELLRLVAGHPDLDLAFATGDSQAGTRAADLYPSLSAAYPDLVFAPYEAGMAEDYALQLNRDAQVRVLETALPVLREGSRVVFVTSHQAHFIRTTPTMPEYEPVALSKRAGEDALRERIPALTERGLEKFLEDAKKIPKD